MKASRAYIAGLGTTGVLLSFALLLLVVFGAILAARGWPEAPAGGDAGAVRPDAGEELTRLEPVRLEAAASPAGAPAAPSAAPAAPSASSPPAATVPAPTPPAPTLPAAPATPAAPALPAAAPGAPSAAAPGLQTGAAEGVAETTTGLVQETGASAERSLPAPP